MSERVQSSDLTSLAGDRVVAVEGPAVPGSTDFYDCAEPYQSVGPPEGYAVIRFESGATLYVDAPALYVDVEARS